MIRVSKLTRPNGYWYVRYWVGGQAVDESTRTKSESAAEQHRLRREMEINAGIQPLKLAEVGDLIQRYLGAFPPHITAKHRHEVNRVLRIFVHVYGRRSRNGKSRLQTQQLTPEMIDRYIAQRQTYQLHDGSNRSRIGRRIVRKKPISNVTLKTELRYLSGFFNWCCRQRPPYLRGNPIRLSNAKSIRGDAKPRYMITDVEFKALLKACTDPRQYLFLLLGWWTGGRRSEILGLHYYHFDFDVCTVDITHGKNNMHGRLPLSPTILQLVKDLYKDAQEADPVFPKAPLPSHSFGHLCKEAGIRHHRFHDFRISTSMKIKCGGFDAGLAGLWVGNQAATNRAHYTDLTAVATQIGSLLEVSDLPPVPSQSA